MQAMDIKFKGLIVGGSLSGGWLEYPEPVKSVFKRELTPTTIDAPLENIEVEKETYIWVSGVHGKDVSKRWSGFWVPENKAKFINGRDDDEGWAINEVLTFYQKYAPTK